MGDVDFGFVHDFGTRRGMDRDARRGRPSERAPLGGERPKDEIEILAFEATRTSLVAEKAAAVVGLAYRLRIMGSLALSLCHLAAGRIDAVCSLKPARAVDIAAAQLLVRERGLAIDLPDAARSRRHRSTSTDVHASSQRERPSCAGGSLSALSASAARAGTTSTGSERVLRRAAREALARALRAHFDTVEVNTTFYRLPRATAVARWVDADSARTSSSRSRRAAT